jgi:hypothetical protein
MTGYTKLFNSILSSTIWREELATKVIWITMLAMADRDGIVEGSVPGLAHFAGATIGETEVAVEKFLSPDPYSRTSEHEGRRVEKVDGGWRLLNADKYRSRMSKEDIQERERLRKQRYRERIKTAAGAECPTESGTEQDSADVSAKSDTYTHTQKEENYISSNADASDLFDHLNSSLRTVWDYYISKIGRDPRTYSFTPARQRIGLKRLKECLVKTSGDIVNAENLMRIAIDQLAASDWHMGRDPKTNGRKYCEWDRHLFKTYEVMEGWWNQ